MRVAQGWLLLSIAAAPYAAATRVSGVKLSGDGNVDGVIDPRVANAPPRAVDPQTCPAVTPRACVLSDTVPAWRSWLGWWRFDLGDCTALDLGSSGLGDRAALALASALAFDGHVVHGGVLMPAKAVSRRRCREGGIQQLSLFNNSIGDAGVAALASAISRHAVLTTLNLRANAIGPEGALALTAELAVAGRLLVAPRKVVGVSPSELPEALLVLKALVLVLRHHGVHVLDHRVDVVDLSVVVHLGSRRK